MLLFPFFPAFLNPAVHWSWKGIYYKIKSPENPVTWKLHLWISFLWRKLVSSKAVYLNSLYWYHMVGERDIVVLVSMLQIMLFWWFEIPWCVIFSCCFELLWSFLCKKKKKSTTPVPHCWRNGIADEKKCTWAGINCQNQHLAVQNKVCSAKFCERVYVHRCTHIHPHN